MEIKSCRRAVAPFELDALHRRWTPLADDPVDRGPEIDRFVRDLEVPQGAADVRLGDVKELARCLVDAHENPQRVDDDLWVRGSLGGQLADAKLPRHLV